MSTFIQVENIAALSDPLVLGTYKGDSAYLPSSKVSGSVSDSISSASFFFLSVATRRGGGLIAEVVENVSGSFLQWKPADVVVVTPQDIDVEMSDLKDPANGVFPWDYDFRVAIRRTSANEPFTTTIADNPSRLVPGRIADIDRRTREIIAQGFTYNSKVFSLSDNAQRTFLGMYVTRATATYPISVPTLDDTAVESLAASTDVEAFYSAMEAALRSALESGVALKQQVMAATTEAEVNAVVDNR